MTLCRSRNPRFPATADYRCLRALHLVGGYYLLLQFTVSFGQRIPEAPLHALALVPLLAVFTLRMVAMASRQTPRAVEAS